MIKLKNMAAMAVGISLLLNIPVYAAEVSSEPMGLEDLKARYLSESREVHMIELETDLLKVQYNASIESYLDFKDVVGDAEDNMNAMKALREQSIRDYERARDANSAAAAARNAEFALMEYIRARSSYRLRVKEDVQMTQNLEPVIFQISQADVRKQASIAKSEFDFERDYYQLVTLEKEVELLKKDIENLKSKIKVDETRINIGMGTETEKKESENQLRNLELTLQSLQNNLELAKEMMKTKLNLTEEELDIQYSLPEVAALKDYRLSDVIAKLNTNNLDLAAVKNNAMISESIFNKVTLAYERIEEYNETQIALKQQQEEQDQIKVAEIEFTKAQINQFNLERNLELYAEQIYYDYQNAKIKLIANQLYNNNLYADKLKAIELNHQYGRISPLEYEAQKQQLNRELNDFEQDIINYVNARSKMELALQGVMVTGN